VILSALLLLFANALSNDSSVIERPFNFGVGSALSALLLVLALRSTGENRVARFGSAACALTFTLSAGTQQIAFCLGQSAHSLIVRLAGDLAFCAAAAWPVTILGLWAQGPYSSPRRRRVGRAVFTAACFSAILLSFAHGIGLLPHHIYYARGMESPVERVDLTAYNGMFSLWLGAFIFLRGRLRELRNLEERLQTVYRGNGRFSFESQPQTGSRAQILIPIPASTKEVDPTHNYLLSP
jgi:hypothetical protein